MDEKNLHHDSEFKKRLEAKMKEISDNLDDTKIMPPKRTPKENFIIKTVSYIIAAPITALITFGALAWGAFGWGFVLYKFWQWFVLPVFTTLPHISISQAVGLMMVVQLFDKNIPQVFDDEFLNSDKKNVFDIISPIITFVFGWIVWFFLIPMGF
jgi:hypothetical protein